jgi:archaellum component FlaC
MESLRSAYSQLEERLTKETAQSEAMVYELMQARSQPRVSRELADELAAVKRQADEQNRTVGQLNQRIEAIQGILQAVRQNYGSEAQSMAGLREQLEQLSARAECIDGVYQLLSTYIDKIDSLREENMKLESEKALAGIEYVESVKVLQEATVVPPQPSIQNSSIALRVAAQEAREEESGYVFTFKEVHRQQDQQDQIHERTEAEESESHSPEDSASMASSFINTLLTKESTARFDQRQENEAAGFGSNINSKLRYGQTNYELRYQREEFLPVERQIENVPAQINRAVSPVQQRGGFFETTGIKRVTSYTHFAPTSHPGSPSYLNW